MATRDPYTSDPQPPTMPASSSGSSGSGTATGSSSAPVGARTEQAAREATEQAKEVLGQASA